MKNCSLEIGNKVRIISYFHSHIYEINKEKTINGHQVMVASCPSMGKEIDFYKKLTDHGKPLPLKVEMGKRYELLK